MKKTAIAKVVFAAFLVLFAVVLITCEEISGIFKPEDAEEEYTDVVYEYVGKGNDIRVKSVTVYLDGTKVPRTAKSRMLDLEAARMGHDFFEVVFWGNNGTTNGHVARTNWEIGQLAGIAGVWRNLPTGVNYGGLTPSPGASAGSSAIFVGKKSSMTLLGVGWLSHINDSPTGMPVIDAATNSVTFTVSPLRTWLGFGGTDKDTLITKSKGGGTGTTATFITAAGAASGAGGFTDNTTTHIRTYPTAANLLTDGANVALRTDVYYPRFDLPSVRSLPADINEVRIPAVYTVGGLDLTGESPAGKDLRTAVRTWGMKNGELGLTPAILAASHTTSTGAGESTTARGGLQFIKRTPAFLYQGTTYGLPNSDDKITTVALVTETAPDTLFADVMNLMITQTKQSGGVFAITFQQPVYLLTVKTSDNVTPGVDAKKWFIRPDYAQYQYLLDDGVSSGGAVLLATDLTAGGGDWIEIKTTGIGFDNE